MLGSMVNWQAALIIERFNEVFDRHDADALADLLTEDTVFEDISPAPDGWRIEGKAGVVEFWRSWFGRNADAQVRCRGNHCQRRSCCSALGLSQIGNGQLWHLRGVDVFSVRDGKVAAKLAYVKG